MSKKNKNKMTELDNFENCEILEGEYVVEKILDKKRHKGVWKYKIKWDGYSIDECTWEPLENLSHILEMVNHFEQYYEKKQEKKNKNKEKNKLNKEILKEKIKEEEKNQIRTETGGFVSEEYNEPMLIDSKNSEDETKDTAFSDSNAQIEYDGNINNDKPLQILNAKILNTSPVELNCLVKWDRRRDGSSPQPTWISSLLLKKRHPDILFSLYESRIKFPNEQDK
jgi:hypothetical protein